MATEGSFQSDNKFLCCICLDVFTDPVTIPCGHNFCKTCITQHWTVNDQHQCPMCKEPFDKTPDLRVNTFISEMVHQFRQTMVNKSSSCSEKQAAEPGGVPCDVCTEAKLKALKSCLVCLTSYCQTHLEPHLRIPGLKRHTLINPVENLEDRMCKIYGRPLGMFYLTDNICVCQFCTVSDHRLHHVVPAIQEYEAKKAVLQTEGTNVQQMIQERRLKIEQIQQSVRLSKDDADKETSASVNVITALIEFIEAGLTEVVKTIEEKQKTIEEQAEGFIRELEEEISELMKRNVVVEQPSHIKDDFKLLQNFTSMNTAPPTEDWTEVRIQTSHRGTVKTTVGQLKNTIDEKVKRLYIDIELNRVQQFAVDITLDPETANPYLILSPNGKEVKHGDVMKDLPDNMERFFPTCVVLGKQSLSSGRCYYEVQVKEKTEWTLGVVSESISRKGKVKARPASKCWSIGLRNNCNYKAFNNTHVPLSIKSDLKKVGVFVDYEEGLVSFYDVDASYLIYSFTDCNFNEKLCMIFGPRSNDGGKNSAPLIICPVGQT
ncbi:E3 ubiquitin-protein ligase TRIM39-like [Sphaeramia orbicularis]|uniref:E3 ubiquitin-protein ligase TRIM39-like n=1 Tax=Sphaeramia orbicularis TaxID=375764 RepID=A0A673C9M4_9TELE|nr:E3 ubiquitin-protein ligase TRIM39-like [Sphaeramia orbicularis]